MLDKSLNNTFNLVTRAEKGAMLTHDEMDENFENILHVTLMTDQFYANEIREILSPRQLPVDVGVDTFVATSKYIAWNIPSTAVDKVATIFTIVGGVKTRISSYAVFSDIDYHNGYEYTYTSASTTTVAPQILAGDLFIMTSSHAIGDTVSIEVADFIPPPPPPIV